MQSYTRAATLSRLYVPAAKCLQVSIYSASVGAHTWDFHLGHLDENKLVSHVIFNSLLDHVSVSFANLAMIFVQVF
jgi:hypothetical protein